MIDELETVVSRYEGVDGFDAKRALAKLQSERLDAEIVHRGETERLYFSDPDGIDVQIQDTRYRGGEFIRK